MARQISIVKLSGTLDRIIFYQTKDGFLARLKTGVDRKRILSDPAFERTRENSSEFGEAARAGKLLRDTLRPLTLKLTDYQFTVRVTQLMSRLKDLDEIHPRGKRHAGAGIKLSEGKALLQEFVFNPHCLPGTVLYKSCLVDADAHTISIPDFDAGRDLCWPEGATHVRLCGGLAAIDLEERTADFSLTNSVELDKDTATGTVSLSPMHVPAGSGSSLYLLQLVFLQERNGVLYELHDVRTKMLRIVGVG